MEAQQAFLGLQTKVKVANVICPAVLLISGFSLFSFILQIILRSPLIVFMASYVEPAPNKSKMLIQNGL